LHAITLGKRGGILGFSGFIVDGLGKLLDSGQRTIKNSKDFSSLSNEELNEKLRSGDQADKIIASKLLLERVGRGGHEPRKK